MFRLHLNVKFGNKSQVNQTLIMIKIVFVTRQQRFCLFSKFQILFSFLFNTLFFIQNVWVIPCKTSKNFEKYHFKK